ncbi:accessory Sec system protein Asp1 [Staphylococcus sp. IVB6227]|uniref:accessory Sec system protein Asp1 n=1 Tax=Staphylococcus sp. IVB6227 TaxID=2989768 RepID=UPI0021CE6AD0|nr:accessory Sec system protein Asp1 [Staphylococcus sp. IVB6227]UXR78484.1 accessory Sec system protein Asp1 [Staphylococcus sp. IVB6227]
MKYFVPAWYDAQRWWQSNAKPLIHRRTVTAFDDMISLMSMHRKNKSPFQLIILNYAPDLRTFLHRYDLYDVEYWSVFDDIQGFTHRTPRAVDYRELNWPEGTAFLQMSQMIRACMPNEMYANIHFNQDGYVIWIEVFQQNTLRYRYLIDDRGFVSSVIFFDAFGDEVQQRYLTGEGDWIIQECLKSGSVLVNARYQDYFKHNQYQSMTSVIHEYLKSYCTTVLEADDVVIAAADKRHQQMVVSLFELHKLCFSVFQQRDYLNERALPPAASNIYWLVDTLENERILTAHQAVVQGGHPVMRVTPFDVQTMSNISSQLHETYIGVWLDIEDETMCQKMWSQLVSYLEQDDTLRLTLLTEKKPHAHPQWIHEAIARVNTQLNTENTVSETEADLMEQPEPIEYVKMKYLPFESDLVESISTLRVVVDLSKEPDLYLQICCLSAGLPQINRCATDYVMHGMNGYIVAGETELVTALDVYLKHLKNWNQSYAYAMKLAKQYTSDKIIAQLDVLIEGETDGTTI